MSHQKVLFVCDENRLRSPTAQVLYSGKGGDMGITGATGIEARSAGIGSHATVPLTEELLEWADIVFVMEKRQRNVIHKKWPEHYARKRIVCLYIPDEYDYMDPMLTRILVTKLEPYIGKPK
jgi:predicted protein tyrosine phosphatase